jgi:hypothetical protein
MEYIGIDVHQGESLFRVSLSGTRASPKLRGTFEVGLPAERSVLYVVNHFGTFGLRT